ncbi:hypothetical protein [Sporomusa acidovorans]|uniref:hypothetical protein n=1 Tax=Sporomusa acidovorans TaxID=112900 RepID=UPI001160CE26|nr:hypothetical protein [Sporomusa acidovorans]
MGKIECPYLIFQIYIPAVRWYDKKNQIPQEAKALPTNTVLFGEPFCLFTEIFCSVAEEDKTIKWGGYCGTSKKC